MQTWRWTELLQMLEMTTTGSYSHVGSQALYVKLLMCSYGNSSGWSARLLSTRLRLRLEFMALFQHGVRM